MSERFAVNIATLLLAAIVLLLALNFYGWPVNRDITTYATIARELSLGGLLYSEIFDTKPPAIFVTYMIAQSLTQSGALQFFLLQAVPLVVVSVALVRSGPRAGFGLAAGLWAACCWAVLSGDVTLQMEWPNTELYINAAVSLAFLQFLRLGDRSSYITPLTIGLLFGIACLFKTVAIAMAVALGLAHLLCPPRGVTPARAFRELVSMSAAGIAVLGGTTAYFALTGRFGVFKEAMVDAGAAYAGDISDNIFRTITLEPLFETMPIARAAAIAALAAAAAAVVYLDEERRRSWVLLAAYGLSALVAVGMPGRFYAHYFQLLVPSAVPWRRLVRALPLRPVSASEGRGSRRRLQPASLAVGAYESRYYLTAPEVVFRGTYTELYIETRALGRRLGAALADAETVYQWGEETGIYWYSGKRAPASILTYPLFEGPQAPRLREQTGRALRTDPPDLIVAANYAARASMDHPIFQWIAANYRPLAPEIEGEREFFTFYVPLNATDEFVGRALGRSPAPPMPSG